jgi:hypothetical protein
MMSCRFLCGSAVVSHWSCSLTSRRHMHVMLLACFVGYMPRQVLVKGFQILTLIPPSEGNHIDWKAYITKVKS